MLASALVLVVFAVGAATLVQRALSIVTPGGAKNTHKLTVVKEASQAGFIYLVPKSDPAWEFDASSPVFDQTKGVVNYKVKLKDGNTNITISQQKTPEELKPVPSSAKFNQFIVASNVTFSEPVGEGKAFFRAALQNGAPAHGSTSVIYASGDILLFGQAGAILPYDKWAKLLSSMEQVAAK